MITTNNTPNHLPIYRLQLEMENSGVFGERLKVLMTDEYGVRDSLTAPRGLDGPHCFTTAGRGCSWTQPIDLPTRAVQSAVDRNQGLALFVGVTTVTHVRSSDGYQPIVNESHRLVGKEVTISAQALKGFVEGVLSAGGELPSLQHRDTPRSN